MLVQCCKEDGVEVDGPDSVVGILQTDVLIDERVGDAEKFVLEAECAAGRDLRICYLCTRSIPARWLTCAEPDERNEEARCARILFESLAG